MTLEDWLDNDILSRIGIENNTVTSANCPHCEYEGEDIRLQPEGLSATLLCPDCGDTILNSEEFTKIHRLQQKAESTPRLPPGDSLSGDKPN